MRRAMLVGLLTIFALLVAEPSGCIADDSSVDFTVAIQGVNYAIATCHMTDAVAQERITITNITLYPAVSYTASGWSKNNTIPVILLSQNTTVLKGDGKTIMFDLTTTWMSSISLVSIIYSRDDSSELVTYEEVITPSYPVGMGGGNDYWLLFPYGFFYIPIVGVFFLQAGIYSLTRPKDWASMPSNAQYRSSLFLRIKLWPYYWVENGRTIWVITIWLIIGFLAGLAAMTYYILFLMGFS